MSKADNTKGREANAAQPLGERIGTSSNTDTKRVAEQSQKKAGPDGGAVGKTFKSK